MIWNGFPGEGGDCSLLYRKFVLSRGLLGEGRRRKHTDVAFNSQHVSQGNRLPLEEGISCHGKQVSKAKENIGERCCGGVSAVEEGRG